MCFSAEADMVAGLVVSAVGIDTVRHVRHGREAGLAVLPLVFGLHQLIEVPVWLGVDGRGPDWLFTGSAWIYIAIAFGVIPWLVPSAVRVAEPDPARTRLMAPLPWLGVLVSLALMAPVVFGSLEVIAAGAHLSYRAPLVLGGPVTALYVLVTCGALLLSSDRVVVAYGAVNLVVVTVLAVLLAAGVISLWCVWAAVTSLAIAVHIRRMHRHDAAAGRRAAPG